MDLDALYRFLRSAHMQAQGVVDTIRDPLLILDDDLTVVSANPAFYKTFETGRDATIGKAFYNLGDGQWDIDELRVLLEQVIPKSASVTDYEISTTFPQGFRTMLVSAQRLHHPDNGQRVLLLTIVDATRRRQVEEEKDVLIGELDHRMKNLFAVTHALARQTDVTGRTAEEYRDAFLGRFEALGRAQDVTAGRRSATLPDLVHAVMEPYLYGSSDVVIADAPCVTLFPSQAMSLGMILHELATNAVKYGALSVSEGEVAIDWTLEADAEDRRLVQLRWQERNGPKTARPNALGFGSRLITFATERELGGRADLDYRPEGLTAVLTFPHHHP